MSNTFPRFFEALSVVGVLAFSLTATSAARADEPAPSKDCPGSWFCGETQPPPNGKDLQPLPADGKPAQAAPPVVVYQPPPTVVVQPREAPPAYYYVPRHAPARKKEWGVNLHGGGLVLGRGQDPNAGMGMAGIGIRFRPVPAFAVEADLDFAGGRDYNGLRRRETSLGFNGIVFLNPKNKAQLYVLAGFGWAAANVTVDDSYGYTTYSRNAAPREYGYFGGMVGGGLELRLSRVVALNADVRGFIRSRVDANKNAEPEFVDARGRSTNTSGGGLIQGGLTFYW